MKNLMIMMIAISLHGVWIEKGWSMARTLPDSSFLNELKGNSQEEYYREITQHAMDYANSNRSPIRLDPQDPRDLFFSAILFGDRSLTQHLLQSVPDLIQTTINTRGGAEITPLMIAALSGSEEIFQALVQKDFNLYLKYSSNGLTPLHFATRAGSLKLTQKILEANPDQVYHFSSQRLTPLHTAALSGSVEVAKFIHEKTHWAYRSDLLAATTMDKNETAFHAAMRSRSFPMIDYLASERPELCRERAPLALAIKKNQPDLVEKILALDPGSGRVQISDPDELAGSTLFHLAIFYKRPEILDQLLENERALEGRPWYIKMFDRVSPIYELNRNQQTAMQLAILMGKLDLVKKLAQVPKLADATEKPDHHPTLLVIKTNQRDTLEFLLTHEPDLAKEIYYFASHSETGDNDVIKSLNLQDEFLYHAVEANQLDVAEFLIAWNHSLIHFEPQERSSTPLELARRLGLQEMLELFEDAEILTALNEMDYPRFETSLRQFNERKFNLIQTALTFSQKNKQNPRAVYHLFLKKIEEAWSKDPSIQPETLGNLDKIIKAYQSYLTDTSSLKRLCLKSLHTHFQKNQLTEIPNLKKFKEIFRQWNDGFCPDLIPGQIDKIERHAYSEMMGSFHDASHSINLEPGSKK